MDFEFLIRIKQKIRTPIAIEIGNVEGAVFNAIEAFRRRESPVTGTECDVQFGIAKVGVGDVQVPVAVEIADTDIGKLKRLPVALGEGPVTPTKEHGKRVTTGNNDVGMPIVVEIDEWWCAIATFVSY